MKLRANHVLRDTMLLILGLFYGVIATLFVRDIIFPVIDATTAAEQSTPGPYDWREAVATKNRL